MGQQLGPEGTLTQSSGRLRYVPALDGLRGLAVAAVLAYHQGYRWADGGFLGVSLFFTLSGFLITSLLVVEHADSGRIRLRSFWARRVRRLAPAGLMGIVLALAVVVVSVPVAQWSAAIADIRAALLEVANWRFIVAETPYVEVGTTPSPVLHYWSLAIEEQFYLVFPVVALLALRRSRRALAGVLVAVVAMSLAAQVYFAGDRVYFGTDTRAAELALGALLALVWPRMRAAVGSRRAWDAIGLVGLVVTGVVWATVQQSDPALSDGALTLVACLSVIVLAGALGGSLVPRMLSIAPLRRLGLVSYGLYVFHFPLFIALSPGSTGLTGTPLFLLRSGVSLAIATVSLLLIERPIRYRRPILGRRLEGAPAGALVVSSIVALVALSVPLARIAPSGATIVPTGLVPTAIAAPGPDAAAGTGSDDAAPEVPTTEPSAATTPAASPDGRRGPTTPPAGGTPTGASTPSGSNRAAGGDTSPTSAARAPRLVIVGDSTAKAIADGLQEWARQTQGLQASAVTSNGCAVLTGEVARYREDFRFRPEGCDALFPTAVEEARRVQADAIVVFIGAPQLADWRFDGDPSWRDITEPAIRATYRRELDTTLELLRGVGVPVLWADVPVPDWDLTTFGNLIGTQLPGRGEPVINDPERTRALNLATEALVDAWDGVTTIEYVAGLAGPDGEIEEGTRADGLHLSQEQAVEAADTWLVPAIGDAFDRAWAELGGSPPERVTWTYRNPSP